MTTEPHNQETLALLQEKWVLHIVWVLLRGPHRFNDLARAVGGCNSATLGERLRRLEQVGLLAHEARSTFPLRTTYHLTDAAQRLRPVLEAIEIWGRSLTDESRPHQWSGQFPGALRAN